MEGYRGAKRRNWISVFCFRFLFFSSKSYGLRRSFSSDQIFPFLARKVGAVHSLGKRSNEDEVLEKVSHLFARVLFHSYSHRSWSRSNLAEFPFSGILAQNCLLFVIDRCLYSAASYVLVGSLTRVSMNIFFPSTTELISFFRAWVTAKQHKKHFFSFLVQK